MKHFFRLLPALVAGLMLPSCVDTGLYYPAGGFPVGGGPAPVVVDEVVGVGPGWGGGGWNSGWGGGGWGGGWGGGGWNRGWGGGPFIGGTAYRCSRCNRNPCCCSRSHQHSSHDHDSRSRSSSSSSRDRQYRIIAGDLDGKKKPNDFHSLDWYHDRGYSLEKLKIETDRGAVIDKRPSSQKSSSKSRSSSSSSSRNNSSSRSSVASNSSSKSKSSSSASRPVSTSKSSSFRDSVRREYQKKK